MKSFSPQTPTCVSSFQTGCFVIFKDNFMGKIINSIHCKVSIKVEPRCTFCLKMLHISSVFFNLLVILIIAVAVQASTDYKSTCNKLLEKLVDSQIKKDIPIHPPYQWHKQKGLFPSSVHFNLVGAPEFELLGVSVRVVD